MSSDSEAVAAIDIGTNSVHLVVAKLDANGSMRVLDSDKATLRLGQSIGPNNLISEEAVGRVVETVRRMKEIAGAYPCRIRAVATHATRVASNHEQLLQAVKDATGIEVEVIDGVEEARLSFLGMRYGLSLHQSIAMGVDVGGGSAEVIIAKGDDVKFVTSLKLGAVVLTKKFFGEKVPSKSDIRDLEEYVSDRIAPLEREVRRFTLERAVIASGTAKALALISAKMRKLDEPQDINGFTIGRADLGKIVERLSDLRDPAKIREQLGVDAARSEIILAGAIIIEKLSKYLGINWWTVSAFGLREGIVVDTCTRFQNFVTRDHPDVRWIAIEDYLARLQIDTVFAKQVADLATGIYDSTSQRMMPKTDPGMRGALRELLRGASLLHEVGRFLSFSRFHRHSCYIISNSSLLGFTQNEKQIMGLVARFHRKGIPVQGAEGLEGVSVRDIEKLQYLSGCLRLATCMNRTRQSRVKGLAFRFDKDFLEILVRYNLADFPEVEMHMAQREKGALEKCFGLKIAFRTESLTPEP